MTLDFQIRNLAKCMFNCAVTQQVSVWLINVNLQTVKIKLNLHLPAYVHFCRVNLTVPQHCFKSVLFFLGQQKDNLLDSTKTVLMFCNVIINYALSPAIAYLSLCKGNRGTNCLLRQLSWFKHCC